ncbi:MAG TPA: hypothetical protein VIT66_01110 [Lysobacter sp.]
MKRASFRFRLLAGCVLGVLLAAPLGSAVAAMPKPVSTPASTLATQAFDPARAWEKFFSDGEYFAAFAAFAVMEEVGYDGNAVDPEKCTKQAAALRKAVAAAPVSIAIRHVAYLCAQGGNDEAAADREMEALAALSRHALAQAGDADVTHPIRVLAPVDASALMRVSDMDVIYAYYTQTRPSRYFPMITVGWDAEAKIERHLVFDFIDTDYRIDRKNQYWGNPMLRNALAEGLIDGWAGQGNEEAKDIKAVRDAADVDDTGEKLEILRPAAQAGGIHAASAWMMLCDGSQRAGCAEGLVDALLSRAERKQALPMLLLAYAYAKGIGVPRDEDAAWNLVDAAERRWPRGAATAQFTRQWLIKSEDIPAKLKQRLDSASAQGSRYPQRLAIKRKVSAGGEARLSDSEIAFMADAGENGNGAGYAVLADYYDRLKDPAKRMPWLEKAALAGDTLSQAYYGSALIYGDVADIKVDPVRGQALVLEAAHGGQAWALRHEADRQESLAKWADAEAWLMPAIQAGDIDAMLDLADLYEYERPGVKGKVERAVTIYRALSDYNDSATARRRLADMAIEGRGMKKNPAQAEQWLRVDAEKGDHESETRLGTAYLYGDFGKADEAEGIRWLQRAIDGKEEVAYTRYAGWLYHRKGTAQARAQALALWHQSGDAGFSRAYNEMAWASCTSPHADMYDPARGMETVAKMPRTDLLDLPELDTVAACYAAGGDFKRAAELQAQALERLEPLVKAEPGVYRAMVKEFRERLALYQSGKRYVDSDMQ